MKTDVQELKQRLEELHCGAQLSAQIAALLCAGDEAGARLLLRRHRKCLLENLHESEKRVDRLDYLVYQIDKRIL